jgi:SAM-dependent methyltransferase
VEDHIYTTMFELERRHWWFRGRWAVISALLARVPQEKSRHVLDAGCGTGLNLERYARLGTAAGIDPSPDAVKFCRQRGLPRVQEASLDALPFQDGAFDLVCSTDVLEHVEDDLEALTELHRVTQPGGHLLLTVPAFMWLWSESDVTLHHKRRYTRRGLATRLRETGWQSEFATYFNSILLPPIALARWVSRGRDRGRTELSQTPPGLDGPLSVPMRLEARAIRAGLRLPIGVSVGMVGRRL